MKKVLGVCVALLLVLIVSACGANGGNGSGKITELNLKEVKSFMDDKKTGFLYVKSALESDKESDQMHLKEIADISKAEKIDFYVFDGKELPESDFYERDASKRTIPQYSGTFAFYKNGQMKEELDFSDLSEDDVHSEIEKFVQKVKQDYLE